MRNRFGRLALAVVLVPPLAPAGQLRGETKDTPDTKAAKVPLGGPFLLANPAPCAELKFNATQTAKVNSVLRDAEKIYRNDQAELSKLPSAEQARPRCALLAKLIREIKKNLEFTCDQSRRFDQIMLQRQRILAFADPEVVAKLKLNRAQRERIADLQRKADTEVRLLRTQAGRRPRVSLETSGQNHSRNDRGRRRRAFT